MWREWLIPSPVVEEGAQLSDHGVNCARSEPDRTAAILTAGLPQKGAAAHMNLSAPTTIPEKEELAHVLGSGAIRRRGCGKGRRKIRVSKEEGAEILRQL